MPSNHYHLYGEPLPLNKSDVRNELDYQRDVLRWLSQRIRAMDRFRKPVSFRQRQALLLQAGEVKRLERLLARLK